MQSGQLFKLHGSWHLRYYTDEIGPDGAPVRRRKSKRLAPINDEYRSRGDLDDLVAATLVQVNKGSTAEGSLTVAEFSERHFIPWLKERKKPSTVKFYSEVLANHVTPRIGDVQLRDVNTRHVQSVLDAASSLSHQSCLRIKTGMSALMSYAIRLGFVSGANPARESKAEGHRSTFKGHAYSLQEIEYMLAHLGEPAKTVCAVAAFSGLRESEIRGLMWSDYDGVYLQVRRSVWRTAISETKTEESTGLVPVIPALRKMLDAHRNRNGHGPFIFSGEKMHRPLHLDNLMRREIKPVLQERWHGWHSFRRGLATNLYNLGVKPEVAQVILRHADASTTRKHYIVLESKKQGVAAMRKLERAVGIGQQMGNKRKRKK
jgi:integrase